MKISDFNSLWEIAFAINAMFVYFDLIPVLEKKFSGTQALGKQFIDDIIGCEEDKKFINTYGWRSLIFGYSIWISRLKGLSVINSISAIFLVILAGYCPNLDLGAFNVVIILMLFTPIIAIPSIITCGLPLYKLKCIEEALYKTLERDDLTTAIKEDRKRKYRITIEFIKLTTFPVLFFLIRDKGLSLKEVAEEFKQ